MQSDLFSDPAPRSSRFDGDTYDHARDHDRLNAQLGRVWRAIKDGQWRTLEQIQVEAGGSLPGISARLRDLRKPRFGGFTIEREHVTRGLFRYRLVLPSERS